MIGSADLQSARGRIKVTILALLFASSLALAGESPAAEPPFEPNDTTVNASGPLLAGQALSAVLETPNDRDFFYFYATSPSSAQAELVITNLGGDSIADFKVTVMDFSATPLAGQAFIRMGEERVIALTLAPQKYFVEVTASEGFGEAYSLSGRGVGAFEPYTGIAERCANATSAVATAQTKLQRAKAKLQRTTARVRRTRYGTPTARQTAHAAQRKARLRVRVGQRTLRKAGYSREPWCSIAQ